MALGAAGLGRELAPALGEHGGDVAQGLGDVGLDVRDLPASGGGAAHAVVDPVDEGRQRQAGELADLREPQPHVHVLAADEAWIDASGLSPCLGSAEEGAGEPRDLVQQAAPEDIGGQPAGGPPLEDVAAPKAQGVAEDSDQRWVLLQRRGQSLHLDRGGCPELLHPLVPSACRQVMAPPSLLGFSSQQTCCVEEQRHIDTRVGSRHQCVWRSCCLERAAFLGSSYRFSSSISHGSPEVRSPTACLVPVVDTEPLGRKLQRYSTNRCTSGRTKGNGVPDSTSHASPRA